MTGIDVLNDMLDAVDAGDYGRVFRLSYDVKYGSLIRQKFESGNPKVKAEDLRTVIYAVMNGHTYQG